MCNATIAEEVMDTGLAARAARRDIHTRMCNNTDVHDSVEAPLDLSLPFCSMWILLRASSYATAAKDARCLVGDIRTEILNKCKRKIRRWYIDEAACLQYNTKQMHIGCAYFHEYMHKSCYRKHPGSEPTSLRRTFFA